MAEPGDEKVTITVQKEAVPVVSKARQWVMTTGVSVLGGGIAGAFAAAMDPGKYRFPRDFGSGKLWEFFLEGAGLVLCGSVLRSPWGMKMMASFQASQEQLKTSRKDLDQAKADLKSGAKN